VRVLKLGMLFAVLGLLAQSAWAGETVLGNAINSCQQDLGKFCSHVKPGEGRKFACLYANDDKISNDCGFALAEAALKFSWARGSWNQVYSACAADFEDHCPRTQMGDGRILRCLTGRVHRKAGVSRGCVAALEGAGLN